MDNFNSVLKGYNPYIYDGLISYFTLDNGIGDKIGTVFPTGYSVEYATGINNTCFSGKTLDEYGATNYIKIISNATGTYNLSEYTISLWINRAANVTYYVPGLGWRTTTEEPIWYYYGSYPYQYLYLTSGQPAFAYNWYGTTFIMFSDYGALSIGVWYHIVVTVSQSSGSVIMYVNNQVANSDGLNPSYGPLYPTDRYIAINEAKSGTPKIDEVAFYNRALSSSEVSILYNNGYGKFY